MSTFPWKRAAVAAGAAFAFACPTPALADDPSCVAVQFLVARGTAEPEGYSLAIDGGLGGPNNSTSVYTYAKNELVNPTDGSTPIPASSISRSDVDYPAEIPWPTTISQTSADSLPFRTSVRKGTQKVIEFLNARNLACPSQRFVLLGYSQGALVMMNAITPDTTKRIMMDGATIATLNASAAAKVAAVGTFADIGLNHANGWTTRASSTVSASAPAYLQGTLDDLTRGRNDGNSSRISSTSLVRDINATTAHDSRIRTYCIKDDFICQGSGGAEQHLYYGDPAKPAPRKSLAVFVVQQLRNEADKTFTNAQCSFQSATNEAVLGQDMSVTLRFQASVTDRAAAGTTTNKADNLRATLSFNYNQQSLLKAALGNPSAIKRIAVNVPVSYEQSTPSGVGFSENKQLLAYTDAITPLTGGFTSPIPGGTQAGSVKSIPWTFIAAGTADIKLGSTFLVMVMGLESGSALLECTLPTAGSEYAGRHFGRVVVTN